MRLLSCVLLVVGASVALADEKPQPPAKAELKKVERDIERFRGQRSTKDRAARVALAKELLEKGKGEAGPRRYAFCESALELAAANGDCGVAFAALDAIDESHDVDHLGWSVEVLALVAKSADSDASEVCERGLAIIERCYTVVETKLMTRVVAALKTKAAALTGELAGRVTAAIDGSADRFKKREDAEAALASAIVKWCEQRTGKSIRRGECTDVAYEALEECGAVPGKGYVFGRLLGKREAVRPGDVLVMESVRTRSWKTAAHHVAVVKSAEKLKLTTYHQNWGDNRSIHVFVFDLSTIVSGGYKVYRPVPK